MTELERVTQAYWASGCTGESRAAYAELLRLGGKEGYAANQATKRIADLEEAIRLIHGVIPGGSICDPQSVADDIRAIPASVGVNFE